MYCHDEGDHQLIRTITLLVARVQQNQSSSYRHYTKAWHIHCLM